MLGSWRPIPSLFSGPFASFCNSRYHVASASEDFLHGTRHLSSRRGRRRRGEGSLPALRLSIRTWAAALYVGSRRLQLPSYSIYSVLSCPFAVWKAAGTVLIRSRAVAGHRNGRATDRLTRAGARCFGDTCVRPTTSRSKKIGSYAHRAELWPPTRRVGTGA